jgi:hypothetical protein
MASESALLVKCDAQTFAISTKHIERMVLFDQVKTDRNTPIVARRIEVDSKAYVAWDLGLLCGMSPQRVAWVLVSVPYKGENLPIALATGQCLIMDFIAFTASAPRNLITQRGEALYKMFQVPARVAGTRVGVMLDVPKLLQPKELAAAAKALGLVGAD